VANSATDLPSGSLAFPTRQRSPFTSIWVRVGVAILCLLITTLVVWFGRSGYRDLDGQLNDFWSCLYYATVSLSTTGYGDITPVTTPARMINVLVVTPLRFVFLITLVGTTIEVLTAEGRTALRQRKWSERVNNHTVVIGYGVKGRTAAQTLIENGKTPADIVVIAMSAESCREANANGFVTVQGDARREEILKDAEVQRASQVVIAADSDDTSVLITLTVRRLNPNVPIAVSARDAENAGLMRNAGANSVIMTAESAGRMLAVSLESPAAGAVLEDLIDPARGFEVYDRLVHADEVGKAPNALAADGFLILEVVRNGQRLRFDAQELGVLQTGDRLVVIRDNTPEAG
jgi:voltage-gated potassium channel